MKENFVKSSNKIIGFIIVETIIKNLFKHEDLPVSEWFCLKLVEEKDQV